MNGQDQSTPNSNLRELRFKVLDKTKENVEFLRRNLGAKNKTNALTTALKLVVVISRWQKSCKARVVFTDPQGNEEVLSLWESNPRDTKKLNRIALNTSEETLSDLEYLQSVSGLVNLGQVIDCTIAFAVRWLRKKQLGYRLHVKRSVWWIFTQTSRIGFNKTTGADVFVN